MTLLVPKFPHSLSRPLPSFTIADTQQLETQVSKSFSLSRSRRRDHRLHCRVAKFVTMRTRQPDILWAQRSHTIYLTVALPDATDTQLKLEPDGRFTFRARSKDVVYEVDVQLYKSVNVCASTMDKARRLPFCVIEKQERGWWERLLKTEGKPPQFVKADWDYWIEEEDEDAISDECFHRLSLNMNKLKIPPSELERTRDSDDEDDDGAPGPCP
uniref:CS domain-containing protein n=3 Tax=Physcomitrium patens TaxID=3218 RepID=A0A2K1KTJ5_PHYPA|nr:hypothetical protein PHYPA_004073 [Physcomitrium patens]